MPQLSLRQPPPQSSAEAIEGELRHAILSKLTYELGKSPDNASDTDWYQATALAVRDRIVDIWMKSRAETENKKKKRVYYLSIEFLIGRLLLDTLTNLRLVAPDAALGNGGLGRLAACFMDSMAALAIPAYGYGIRYENGLFEQRLHDGWQQEWPEDWLARGNPWEFKRTEPHYSIGFGGAVEYFGGDDKTPAAAWYPAERVDAVAYDTPIAGWRGRHVN